MILAAEALVIYRLFGAGLWRRYPLFALMMAAGAIQHVAGSVWAGAYPDIWRASMPILIVLQALAAWEIAAAWRQVFVVSSFARILPVAAGAAGALLARFSLPASGAVHILVEIQRDASFAIALALVVIGVFYGLPARHFAPKDLRIHTGLMASYWAGTACVWTLLALAPESRPWVEVFYVALRLIVLVTWASLMRFYPVPPRPTGPSGAEVLAQIEQIQHLR